MNLLLWKLALFWKEIQNYGAYGPKDLNSTSRAKLYRIVERVAGMSDFPPVRNPLPRIANHVLQTVLCLSRKRRHLVSKQVSN